MSGRFRPKSEMSQGTEAESGVKGLGARRNRRPMMESCGETHVGRVRSNNEDSFDSVPQLGFYVVADGLGGAVAGERASKITVDTLVSEVRASGDSITILGVSEAVELANRNVRWEAENDLSLRGMGTTVTAALASEGRLQIANVGDSRAYRLRQGVLECLTDDDTWLRDLAKDPTISAEQLRRHPYRNVLTKAIGAESVVRAATVEADFRPGDILLLCSDGLHGVLPEEEITSLLNTRTSLRAMAGDLIAATLARGAPDNVTVVLVRHPPDEEVE